MVSVDAAALWLKLRGEEKVYLRESELQARGAKARVKRLRSKFLATQAEEDKKRSPPAASSCEGLA